MGERSTPSTTNPSQLCRKSIRLTQSERNGDKDTHLEGDVRELHAITIDGVHRTPILINVETISRAPRNEVLEEDVLDVSRAAIGLDHIDLVTTIGIDVAVKDVLDRCIGSQGTHRTTSGLVAPDLLDKDVVCRRLDGDTFIAVGDFDVVNPNIGS